VVKCNAHVDWLSTAPCMNARSHAAKGYYRCFPTQSCSPKFKSLWTCGIPTGTCPSYRPIDHDKLVCLETRLLHNRGARIYICAGSAVQAAFGFSPAGESNRPAARFSPKNGNAILVSQNANAKEPTGLIEVGEAKVVCLIKNDGLISVQVKKCANEGVVDSRQSFVGVGSRIRVHDSQPPRIVTVVLE
jgi:hypothetical protein